MLRSILLAEWIGFALPSWKWFLVKAFFLLEGFGWLLTRWDCS